jgi:hypothetical protein
MLSWLAGGAISTGLRLAEKGLDYLNRRQDAAVERYKADVGAITTLGGEALRIEAARHAAQANVAIAAMAHPIWWAAWAMFVVPVGIYDGLIYFVSTFDAWLNTPGCVIPKAGETIRAGARLCEWYVRAVPPDQAASRANIIYFIFGAQAASGVAAGLGQAAARWLARR